MWSEQEAQTEQIEIRRGVYYDSFQLMRVSRRAGESSGVDQAHAVMATALNVQFLEDLGFRPREKGKISPDDLLIAVRAESASAAQGAVTAVEELLDHSDNSSRDDVGFAPKTVRAASRRRPSLNVAVVSVPGRYAGYEVASALEAGLHVFCFTADVALGLEAELKEQAITRGLLLMGADCGTAIIHGIGLGFANATAHGPVGIVGASGTGIQEIVSLLDSVGVGISHAIGVGGRDLSSEVGGIMTKHVLRLLEADIKTRAIVVVAKSLDATVWNAVYEAAERTRKPTVYALLGGGEATVTTAGGEARGVLETAAARAAELIIGAKVPLPDSSPRPRRTGGLIRGLFCGGTLCQEAAEIIRASGREVATNVISTNDSRVESLESSSRDILIDFGADEFTQGRTHPIIDPSVRRERLLREAHDDRVGVILLDLILGYGAPSDPAGELVPAVEAALRARDGDLAVIISICGTRGDPQGLDSQSAKLRATGAVVTRNNGLAARIALEAAEGGRM